MYFILFGILPKESLKPFYPQCNFIGKQKITVKIVSIVMREHPLSDEHIRMIFLFLVKHRTLYTDAAAESQKEFFTLLGGCIYQLFVNLEGMGNIVFHIF